MHYIYVITNVVNGKRYIGQSKDVRQRWRYHKSASKNPKQVIHYAIAKHGIEAFELDILEELDTQKEANECEKYWIEHYDSLKNGYNSVPGGKAVSGRDHPMYGIDPPNKIFLNKSVVAEIVHNYMVDKKSLCELSDIYKVSRPTLRRILDEENISIRDGALTKDEEKLACQLYLDGYSSYYIADIMLCSRVTVCRALQLNNIHITGPSRNVGKRLSPQTEFKKGRIPWNAGKYGLRLSIKSEFKKGHVPSNKLSPKQEREICAKYRELKSPSEVAKLCNCNRSTVYRVLKRHAKNNR